jgi:hypothetical protein
MKTTDKLIMFIFTFFVLTASTYAQTPREELQQILSSLLLEARRGMASMSPWNGWQLHCSVEVC